MSIFSWFKKGQPCLLCGDRTDAIYLCVKCSGQMKSQDSICDNIFFTSGSGQTFSFSGDSDGGYWGADSTFYGNTFGPTYTGLSGAQFTMSHPAAYARPALGGGTRNVPIENAGIRAGEIIAYRCWILTEQAIQNDDWLLRSTYANCTWRPGEMVGLDPDYAPNISSDGELAMNEEDRARYRKLSVGGIHGVHGFKEASHMLREFYYAIGYDYSYVYGTVALWGEIIEHKMGFRAEWGRVNTIDSVASGNLKDSEYLAKLRKVYGVEGKSHTDFKIGAGP